MAQLTLTIQTENVTDRHLQAYFTTDHSSKWYDFHGGVKQHILMDLGITQLDLFNMIMSLPQLTIGRLMYRRARNGNDDRMQNIPNVQVAIGQAIDQGRTIDTDFLQQISAIFDNQLYGWYYNNPDKNMVTTFLQKWKGYSIFSLVF